MTPAEECKTLAKHAEQLFSAAPFAAPSLLEMPSEWFTVEAWTWALGHTGINGEQQSST